MGKYNIWYWFFLLRHLGSRRNFWSIEYRSTPSFLLDPWWKGRVVFVEGFLDDIGWSASLTLGDFSFSKDCTSPDSLGLKLDGPKGDIAEEPSEECDAKKSAKALERKSEDGR